VNPKWVPRNVTAHGESNLSGLQNLCCMTEEFMQSDTRERSNLTKDYLFWIEK